MKSWMYMMYHSTLAKMHAKYLIAGAKGDTEALREEYLKIRAYLSEHELELHDVFDGFLYIQNMAQKASVPLTTYYQ